MNSIKNLKRKGWIVKSWRNNVGDKIRMFKNREMNVRL